MEGYLLRAYILTCSPLQSYILFLDGVKQALILQLAVKRHFKQCRHIIDLCFTVFKKHLQAVVFQSFNFLWPWHHMNLSLCIITLLYTLFYHKTDTKLMQKITVLLLSVR
ncbi:hypothetical protein DSY3555 [Desulfitobacterium hafniense Y51]|uniref:Uncharacterized protein n=1 Tax=Desulfitobacterium hafniense (strain Y51) TaxID=138119 RepID=Q24RJ8_DESHY|nr:hypothetical protein DSY3555 [Desulfitobacterium hafniense Y51]